MTARKTSATPAKTTRASAATKTAAPAKKAAPVEKPASEGAAASVTRLPTADPQAAATEEKVLRKKELFERVVEATGAKKKDVKPIVEATLKLLGDTLSSGDDLVLPPLGKAKVSKQKDLGSAEMLVIRLRRTEANSGSDSKSDSES